MYDYAFVRTIYTYYLVPQCPFSVSHDNCNPSNYRTPDYR